LAAAAIEKSAFILSKGVAKP